MIPVFNIGAIRVKERFTCIEKIKCILVFAMNFYRYRCKKFTYNFNVVSSITVAKKGR